MLLGTLPIMRSQPVAHAIFLLAIVAVAGLALGSIKYRGIALGTAGVVFAGILVGHFGERVDHATLDFVKEFGLVLFVFTIGLQLGPGFVAALRDQGMRLNLLATAIVLGGRGGGGDPGEAPAASTSPRPSGCWPARRRTPRRSAPRSRR